MRRSDLLGLAACTLLLTSQVAAQVTYDRILRADEEPGNWLTYNRSYDSRHHSPLDEINRENAGELELKWVFQAKSLEKFESTALAVDGVIYNVQMPNDVVALDAVTGRKFWQYTHVMAETVNVCCGRVNRGLAILGETLYMGTIDGKVVALDAKNGAVVFSKQLVDPSGGYSLTHAPLVLRDKIIVGTAFVASSWRWIRRMATRSGASTRFPVRANRATKRGPAIRGSAAAGLSGSRGRTIPN